MTKYPHGRHPNSLANLGKRSTVAGKKLICLNQAALDWLNDQCNASAAVCRLIEEEVRRAEAKEGGATAGKQKSSIASSVKKKSVERFRRGV